MRRDRWRCATLVTVAAAGAAPLAAQAPTWSVELAPAYVRVAGHDEHVLTRRGAGRTESLELDTDDALGYRAAVLHDRGTWAYGLDFFIHRTDQGLGPLRDPAGGGSLTLELPHRTFEAGPGETLFYQTLEDTTIELWVVDLYARRELLERGAGGLSVVFGVRNADFDNDHRAIGGIEGVEGVRIDASSNYSRMIGPLAGLLLALDRGRHTFSADLRQSLVIGDIELTRTLRDFTGPPGPFAGSPEELPPGLTQERLATTDSIDVPMTDLRLAWSYRLSPGWAVGASGGATAWWDLAVPPGVVPSRPDAREEITLVTYDLAAELRFSF